jgi:hypothetical protein
MFRPVVKRVLNAVPGLHEILISRQGGDTGSAAYCYGVWLKHLCFLHQSGVTTPPATVAELGPGKSLGAGLAAMLCGADHYYALDVTDYRNSELNLRILDELVALYRARAPRPSPGWPCFDHLLDERLFPAGILTDELLEASLSQSRVASIRSALLHGRSDDGNITITYLAPWRQSDALREAPVDLIFSHSVLQYLEDLDVAYALLHGWLKPGGAISHQIDFSSMGLTRKWNGYRSWPEARWKLIVGTASYVINRQPHSVHLNLLARHGFDVLADLTSHRDDGLRRAELAAAWRQLDDFDLNCSGAFIQAQRAILRVDSAHDKHWQATPRKNLGRDGAEQ